MHHFPSVISYYAILDRNLTGIDETLKHLKIVTDLIAVLANKWNDEAAAGTQQQWGRSSMPGLKGPWKEHLLPPSEDWFLGAGPRQKLWLGEKTRWKCCLHFHKMFYPNLPHINWTADWKAGIKGNECLASHSSQTPINWTEVEAPEVRLSCTQRRAEKDQE